MPSTPTPNPPTALREGRPWFGFGVHAALVAVETCLLVACFGTVLESVFLKFIGYASFDRWKIHALAGVSAAYLIGHVRNRPISYRTLRLSPPRRRWWLEPRSMAFQQWLPSRSNRPGLLKQRTWKSRPSCVA